MRGRFSGILALAGACASLGCDVVTGLDEIEPTVQSAEDAGDTGWVRHVSAAGAQRITALAVDGDGNVIVAGTFEGSIDLGGGALVNTATPDVFVAKLDRTGDHVWSRQFGDPFDVEVTSIAVGASGEIAVVGRFWGALAFEGPELPASDNNDAFLVLLDAAGEPRWSVSATEGADQRAYGVAFDADQYIRVAGVYEGGIDFHDVDGVLVTELAATGESDVFVAQYDPYGTLGWAKSFGDGAYQRATALAASGTDVVIAGTTLGAIDFGAHAVAPKGSTDAFVARLDAAGSSLWADSIGDARKNCHDVCEVALAAGGGGRVFMAGSFSGQIDLGAGPLQAAVPDVFVAELQEIGDLGRPRASWSRRFGDVAFPQRPYGLAAVPGGGVVVAGLFGGAIDFEPGLHQDDGVAMDVFVAELDASGATRWSVAFPITSGQPHPDEPGGPRVAVDAAGEVVVAGTFPGSMTVGSAELVAAGGDADVDAYVLKLPRR